MRDSKSSPPPTREIGTIYVLAERDFHFYEAPPTARPPETIVVVEGAAHEMTQGALRLRVSGSRRGMRDNLTVDDLGAHVLRQRQEIRVGRAPTHRLSHSEILA